MAQLTYIGPFDEVELPDHGLVLQQGETFEVDEDVALSLLTQVSNFEPADTHAHDLLESFTEEERASHAGEVYEAPVVDEAKLRSLKKDELIELADYLGVDLTGASTNDDKVAAILPHITIAEES